MVPPEPDHDETGASVEAGAADPTADPNAAALSPHPAPAGDEVADAPARAAGPWALVEALRDWAEATPWCDWLELGGSLGRGAGDELSDVDAGVGVLIDDDLEYAGRRDAAQAAAVDFAAVADVLVQSLGTPERPADHLVVQYADGRQLSLVVMPAQARQGLPPGARALLDRSARLSRPFAPPVLTASDSQLREWAFLAWWAVADVAKHAARGSVWRAVESLHEARTQAWRLHAAAAHVDYPTFGAVSCENAGVPAPTGLAATVSLPETEALLDAARALSDVLDPLTAAHEVEGVRAEALRRLSLA